MIDGAHTMLRVLLVEDSDDHAELLEYELGRCGLPLSAHRVRTMDEARCRLDAGSWDLVLMDLNLPDSDRHATLDSIPEIGAGGVPVVVLTSLWLDREDEVARDRGAAACLAKTPELFTSRLLAKSIRKLLG